MPSRKLGIALQLFLAIDYKPKASLTDSIFI